MQLDKALCAIMAALAQRLQRPGEELRAIAVVRLDVIDNLGRHDLARLQAVCAQRMLAHLICTKPLPSRRRVQPRPGVI